MNGKFVFVGLLALAVLLSGCVEPIACPEDAKVCPDGSTVLRNPSLNCEFDPCPEAPCAGEGENFSEEKDCCTGLVRAVVTCEKCKKEDEPLAFDGIPCCEGLEAVNGFCKMPGEELPCRKEGETIPVIANPPECCEGLSLIPPKDPQIVGIMGYCSAKCGNGICDETESNYNCQEDCKIDCIENWACTSWSDCTSGQQTRTCVDSSDCGTTTNKPATSQSCAVDECSTSSNCNDNNPCTTDTCYGTPKICSNTLITTCINGDNCCPIECTYTTDSDCPTTDQCTRNSDCDDGDDSTYNICNSNQCYFPDKCDYCGDYYKCESDECVAKSCDELGYSSCIGDSYCNGFIYGEDYCCIGSCEDNLDSLDICESDEDCADSTFTGKYICVNNNVYRINQSYSCEEFSDNIKRCDPHSYPKLYNMCSDGEEICNADSGTCIDADLN